MRTKIATCVVIAAIALYWARSTHGQVQPVPGPGSGIVTVQGEVDIRRLPGLDVGQRGDWRCRWPTSRMSEWSTRQLSCLRY